jgi:hypothetical protein
VTSHCALAAFVVAIAVGSASAPASAFSSTAPAASSRIAPITPTVTVDCIARAAAVEKNGTTTITPARLQPGNPMPAFPPGEPRRFVVSVVVDTVGRAEPATLEVPPSLDSVTVAALRTVLPAWHFSPARVGACPVRQVVRLTFSR